MRRARIKIHEAEPTLAGAEQEEPEIEFMPPREVPLPDYPDAWPHDRTYPQFEGKNMTKGWWSEFAPRMDADDDDEYSEFEERVKEARAMQEKQMARQAKMAPAMKTSGLHQVTRAPLTTKAPQTLTAKQAASALSRQPKPAAVPSFAAPTVAAKSRLPSNVTSKKTASWTLSAARRGAAVVAMTATTDRIERIRSRFHSGQF